jgi:hypothetical protein
LNGDANVMAALALLLDERAEAAAAQARRIHSLALDALEAAIGNGDVRSTLAVIQQSGLAMPSPIIIEDHHGSDAGESGTEMRDVLDQSLRVQFSFVGPGGIEPPTERL